MTLNYETYELIDEYLDSAIQVLKEMYQEHGEEVFTLLEDYDFLEV